MDSFSLKKLNEAAGKEQCRVEISSRFAALENLDSEVDIISAWETVRENIKISGRESIMNWRSISHGSTKDARTYWIKGNKLNCSGYRIQVKQMGMT
jgi:hypothetical protein